MIVRPDRPCASCGVAEREISSYCRPCSRAKTRNSTHKSDSWRRYKRKNKHGLTEEQWTFLIYDHDKKCCICGSSDRVSVDHNHETGVIRGILCRRCNFGIGNFRDDPDLLQIAASYLGREVVIKVEVTGDEK